MEELLDLTAFWPEFEAEVRENLRQLEEGILGLQDATDAADRVHELMRLAHTVKGAARLMAQEEIAGHAETLEHTLRDVREGECPLTDDLKANLLLMLDNLAAALDSAAPSAGPDPAEEFSPPASRESNREDRPPSPNGESTSGRPALAPARVDVAHLDHLTALGTVLHIQHMRLKEIRRGLEAEARATNRNIVSSAREGDTGQRLRGLHAEMARIVDEMGLTLQSLEAALLDMRLVPFDVLVPVLRRVVRDAARNLGKRVDFRVEGGHVRIDRQLVGPLQDALIHLLRNALDHGIASPQERERAGKSPMGTVRVVVSSEANMITVRVEDDGRGVDVEQVRDKAVEHGILLPAEAQSLGERDLLRLLFRPGFTTRKEVSTFSGQGVGLDAVATIVHRLGGDVDIESTPGRGTAIILRLPMNLALVDVALVQVGAYRVAIPLSHVASVLPREKTTFLTQGARHMVRWQESPLPAFSLASLFGLSRHEHEGRHVIILRSGREHIAAEGCSVYDQVTLALRPLPALIQITPFVYGASILGDSSVVFVMAVEPLIRYARTHTETADGSSTPTAPTRPRRVLVVDDGVTTRDLLRSALTAVGYEVLTARDGEEALQVLTREGPVDLVITDVQMPRVDGITLTRRLRSDPAWRDLPIIILSIQANPDDLRRGLEAGASAYLTKQNFDEGTLLETIEQVL